MENDIWFRALLNKYRFKCSKGDISTEDLFSLDTKYIEEIYADLEDELSRLGKKTLFGKQTAEMEALQGKIDVITAVADYRIAKANAEDRLRKNKAVKEEINSIILQKEKDKLGNMSIEELKQLRDSL